MHSRQSRIAVGRKACIDAAAKKVRFTTDGVTFYNRVYSSGEDTTGYTWGACDSACGLKQPNECSETTEEADTTFYVSGTLTLSGAAEAATAVNGG